MRIDNLREERTHDRARVVATVTWEDSNQPTTDVYFETDAAFADSLTCNSHAFLVGCLMPAMHHGEERVFIDAEICPELREGLITVMSWIRYWYCEHDKQLPRIEAKTRPKVLNPGKPERAGFFISGGIDSFAALRANRLNFPLEHPGSFKDGLVVYGLHMQEPENFKQVLNSVSAIAKEAGIIVIPVYSNVVSLGHGWDFWADEFFAAAFAAVAHAFTKRFTVVSLASAGWGITTLPPQGSHPLVDPNYSSSDLRIRHDGITLSRLEKTRLVSEWDIALQHLRVCNNTNFIRPEMLNCGQCEKCVRTMLTFLAIGKLDKAYTFPAIDISEDLVRSAVSLHATTVPFYRDLLLPLAGQGRHDLVRAIQRKLNRYHRSEKAARLKEQVREMDQKFFRGKLINLKRSLHWNTRRATGN